ncbi:acetolactate synthase-1/2/3 large subunit [Singulisphaera sp. GP187]|uniref:thiamine pyrophosphate-binding protein n=1 Tax=Singulisphaera sp. GP187 TaxID=1882752 RepID=UPI000926B6AA|nr:thiamine pyrophosphate-binding protein [Singulisphaera sp. GP187]SIO62205.1 acetolactate synthase-1/2/3 large subunit [Singulisphaera sp. GP187]
MALNLSRREALGVLGAIGAATASSAATSVAAGHVEVGRYVKRQGVHGRMTGAQAAAAALACEGVACVFGIPGAQSNEFWDALKARRVPYLLVTNESSASVMADAAARVTGQPGVFNVVPGPGLTNAMTGIGEALLDSVPIVGIITDVIQGPDAPLGQVHSLPNTALLRPLVKALIEVHHQAEIPGAIYQAFEIARSGEPGPVGIMISFPHFTAVWDYDQAPPPPRPLPFDENAYRQVLGHLSNRSRRVGIYAGLGCMDAGPALAAVAEMLQAPVATSVSGKGCIPDGHPLAVGWGYGKQGTRAAEKTFKDVDLVLAVGVRYSEVSTANYAIPPHNVIHVDANPNNLGRNVPTCVKLCADSQVFFDRLLADAPALQRPACPPLWKKIQDIRQVDHRENSVPKITRGVDPMYFLTQLRCALGPDELIFVDVTASTHWASEAITVQGPRRYFTPTNNQSMGWALPAAIGAQRVRPDRQVVSITGDGCFLMSAMELSTAARACLPVKFFVLDDGAYHYMQMLQEPVYRRTTATEIARINYAAFAQGVGLGYNEIGQNPDVGPGIARALATPGPLLTRVVISYEGREVRWLNALKSTYVSRLPTDAKVRMASRIGVRSLSRRPDDD